MSDPQCGLSNNTLCETFLTRGQATGIVIAAEAGILSIAAVLLIFVMMIRNISRHYPQHGLRQLIKSPIEVYMLSLLIGDLIQGLGIALVVRWIATGTVTCGSYCTAEGVIQQMGEAIVAMSILAMAVHTFIIIFFRRGGGGVLFATFLVCLIWVYVILFVSISAGLHTKGNVHFDTPTPYWCWIGSHFLAERIAGEYFWFWFTALVSLVLYVMLFFCLRGNIDTEDKRWWRIHFRKQPRLFTMSSIDAQEAGQTSQMADKLPHDSKIAAKKALMMLLYPVCYVALVLPLSIVRWIDFIPQARHPDDNPNSHLSIPSAATIVVHSIFALGGVVNATLILCARPGILLLGETPKPRPHALIFASSAMVDVGVGGRDRSNLKLRPYIPMREASGESIPE